MEYVEERDSAAGGISSDGFLGLSGDEGISLPSPLIIPSVIEPDNPKGLPMATICSPILKDVESPIGSDMSLSEGMLFPSIFNTARSENGSPPINLALYTVPSRNVICTFLTAPAIT